MGKNTGQDGGNGQSLIVLINLANGHQFG